MYYKIFLVCFLSPVMLFAQNGSGAYKIYYEMTFQKDSTEAQFTTELTELLVNKEKSLFRTQVRAIRDTVSYHKDLTPSDLGMIYLNTVGQYRVLKDYKEKNIYYYESIQPLLGAIHYSVEPQSVLDWSIEPDTMTINHMLCQKATVNFGNRFWDAWFTVDIPISDGPYKFCGLPGLIVAIADNTGSWAFKLLSIEHIPPFEFHLRFLENSSLLDPVSFYKRKRHYRDNMAQISEAAGTIKFPTEEMRQYTYRSNKIQAKKDNNWIEHYP